MRTILINTAALLVAASTAVCGDPVTAPTSQLTLAGARQIIASAVNEAQRLKSPGGSIAVVDAGGHLVALERLDHSFTASPGIAIGKARTAALFQKPTRVFETLINEGRTTMVTLPEFTPLQGGVPIEADGEIVGAVGVSGAASAQQDDAIATFAAQALHAAGKR
jgi:glc operon protein GlcG